MKLNPFFFMLTLILLGLATTTYAQIPRTFGARRFQLDDGSNHYSLINGSSTGGTYTLQNGGGIILTTGGSNGTTSPVWLLGGNTGAGASNQIGTLDNTALNLVAGAGGPNNRLTILSGGNVGVGTTAPNSTFQVAGSFATNVNTIPFFIFNYTAQATDAIISADPFFSFFLNISLPTSVGIKGRQYTIKWVPQGPPFGANITIVPFGAEKIDGQANYVLNAAYKYVTLVSDGTQWLVVANN